LLLLYNVRFHSSIEEIDSPAWNRLARGAGPFLQHAFLHALEASGSVGQDTGWLPRHISVWPRTSSAAAAAEAPCAVMPMYVKHHSYGEYVFDWAWADAWHNNGVAYYPKLVSAIPFTPSVSPRLQTGDVCADPQIMQAVYRAVQDHAQEVEASSWHILFPPEAESEHWHRLGMSRRTGTQFHWHNRGYGDFTDFLDTMSSRKRKVLRKERQVVRDAGTHFEVLNGREADTQAWDRFYRFYQSTYAMRGQRGYLTRDFFERLAETMPDAVCLVMAFQRGEAIAGALNLVGDDTLYGRYWGCSQDQPFLHFETCLYQGIDVCIRRGLKRFDAGAQGEHKIKRGFEPMQTFSSHWLADSRFRPAIDQFCEQEARHVQRYMAAAGELLPYRAR